MNKFYLGLGEFETETIHPKMFKSLEIREEGCSEQSRFKPRSFPGNFLVSMYALKK